MTLQFKHHPCLHLCRIKFFDSPEFGEAEGEVVLCGGVQAQLMAPPNQTWREIVLQASAQPDILKQSEVIRNVQNILSTNASVASSLGQPFLSQITLIYLDMLNMYRCALLLLSVLLSFPDLLSTKISRMF